MTCPVWSKWGALLCSSTGDLIQLWQKPVGGLHWPANAKRHPMSPLELTRNGQSMWTELSFLSQTFQSLWPFHNSLGIRSTNLIYRRRQWHPTPVLLPGKSHGWRSLVGCSPWGRWGSDTTEQLHFHTLEKEMATHSRVLAWRIPGTGEPGGCPMGSHRVRHNWSDLA